MTDARASRAFWRFLVDWNADGDWDEANEDITEYVLSAEWRLGMHQPWQLTADETTARIALDNSTRRFSPGYPGVLGGPTMEPQRRVKITAQAPIVLNDGVTVVVDNAGDPVADHARALWIGWIASMTPTMGRYSGPFQTVLDCVGVKQFLAADEVSLPLLENVTADEIIRQIFQRSSFPPAALGGNGWAIGIRSRSEIGQTTYLASAAQFYDLELGQRTYPYAGDNWDRFATAYDAIVSVVQAERGRLFFNREGKAVFWNRQHLQKATADPLAASYDDNMQGLVYVYGDDVVNDARVTVYPRALSATSTEILWQLDQPLALKPGERREIKARYAAADGQQVAGRNIVTPNTGDGSLVFTKGTATIVKIEADARSATITLENNSHRRDCAIAAMTLRGQKLTSWNAQEVREIDAESIAAYGRQVLRIDARLLGDAAFARSIAQNELYQRKTPRGMVRAVRFMNKDSATLLEMLDRTMGDCVDVRETMIAGTFPSVVMGETHEWRDAGTNYQATLAVEPVPANRPWLIGIADYSNIGTSTCVGF